MIKLTPGKQMTIGQKLAASFGVMLALTCLLSYSSLAVVNRLGGILSTSVNENSRVADLISSIKLQLREMKELATATQFSYAVSSVLKADSHQAKTVESLGDCATCHAFGAPDEHRNGFAKLADRASATFNQLRPLIKSQKERESLEVIGQAIGDWRQIFDQYVDFASKGDFAGGHALVTDKMEPLLERVNAAAQTLETGQRALLDAANASAGKSVAASRWTTSVLIAISIACGIFLFFTIRKINRSLSEISCQLRDGAQRVAENAGLVSETSRTLQEGTSQQASALEETAAASEQVNATAHNNSDFAARATKLAQEVGRGMGETNQVLEKTVHAMQEIGRSSERISNIIKVINEIAFQTNLLALNAAVEAARAGEAGMGFAVVADEVRTLARRCSDAAKDTENLIGESIARAHDGQAHLDQLNSRIQTIAQKTIEMTSLSDQVQSGSLEQAQAMEQVDKALQQMQAMTEKTAANAEESAGVGEHLTEESGDLNEVVQRLERLVGAACVFSRKR